MRAEVFKGRKLAQQEEELLGQEVHEISKKRVPRLVSLLVGDDYGAKIYSNVQKKAAKRIGIDYELRKMSKDISTENLLKQISVLNKEKTVDGIFLHQPIAADVDEVKIRESILPCKDVECEHPENLGKIFSFKNDLDNKKVLLPPTPAAILYTIGKMNLELYGKEVVIVGHSNIVGKPLSLLLLNRFATVTVTHIATFEAGKLEPHIRKADLVISAVGEPNLIKGNWIKEKAFVIDVGITKTENGMKGDVEFDSALEKADFITPVPGGIGPLTVIFLMKNLVNLFKKNSN